MSAPVGADEFAAAVPHPSASICTAFVKALLKLPALLAKFIKWMIDDDGNFTVAFKKMISDITCRPGDLIFSGRNTDTDGRLLCNGQAVSRETYADLFAAIGTAFGVGDNATTFNVPNYSDRFPVGVGGTKTLGSTGGVASQTLVEANIPKIQLKILADNGKEFNSVAGTGDAINSVGIGYESSAENRETVLTSPFGSATPTALDNQPPYLACYIYIKT